MLRQTQVSFEDAGVNHFMLFCKLAAAKDNHELDNAKSVKEWLGEEREDLLDDQTKICQKFFTLLTRAPQSSRSLYSCVCVMKPEENSSARDTLCRLEEELIKLDEHPLSALVIIESLRHRLPHPRVRNL